MWAKLKQALVYRAQFFDIERVVVDASQRACRVFLIPGEIPEGCEQVAIGDSKRVEVLRGEELAVQRREEVMR
jgi:hypothetical protein